MLSISSTKSIASGAAHSADKIAPLHFFDDSPLWRAFILYSMFVFDDVLDVLKLHTSLECLIRKDGWWKLGARLRQDNKGDLYYHVPSTFTEEHPALAYSHVVYDITAADHPLASRLPKASTKPAIVGDSDDFHDLMRPLGSPMKLKDYLMADRPQLGLHIVSFKDKTLVSLYWPHTLFDAMGKKALLNAWSLMIQRREDEVVSPHGADSDPLATLGLTTTEPHKLISRRMGAFRLVGYGLRQIRSIVRKKENRMVCVPAGFVQALRELAIADLASHSATGAVHIGEDGLQSPFLSEGDVLCAWWTRLAISHISPASSQTVVLNNAYCLRHSLSPDLIPSSASYVSNAIGFIPVLLTAKNILSKPLSYVASSIRSTIAELGTRSQVDAFAALVRESSASLPPIFGDSGMHMVTYSNWTKAKLFELDFSAAVVRTGASDVQTVSTKLGRPSYIQNNQFGLTMPNAFLIIGKDNEGNFWLSGYLDRGHWDQIREVLSKGA